MVVDDLYRGQELWVFENTLDGPHLVRDLALGMNSSFPSYLTPYRAFTPRSASSTG
jgi:ELWxxDGT repeat protein